MAVFVAFNTICHIVPWKTGSIAYDTATRNKQGDTSIGMKIKRTADTSHRNAFDYIEENFTIRVVVCHIDRQNKMKQTLKLKRHFMKFNVVNLVLDMYVKNSANFNSVVQSIPTIKSQHIV